MNLIKYIFIATLISGQSFSLYAKEHTEMFRYKDKSGNVIVDNVLPPEFANDGYEILSERGNVLETIPPKRTQADIEKDKADQKLKLIADMQEKEKIAKLQEERAKDEILLKSFSSEKDIENSKDSKIASIEVLENITKGHIQQLSKQLEEARSQAANYERIGRGIPENVFKTIEESKRQISDNEAFLKSKAEEKSKIISQFKDDLARFQALKIKETSLKQMAPPPKSTVE